MSQKIWCKGIVMIASLTLVTCGGSSSTTDTTGSDSGTDSTTSGAAAIMGSDVVISSPTAQVASTAALSAKGLAKATGDFDTKDFEAKKDALQNLLTGANECSFTPIFSVGAGPSCYGPTIVYCDHDNATTSDGDCSFTTSGAGTPEGDDGFLPTGDLGIWSEYEGNSTTGEACAAAEANHLVESVAARIDNAINLMGAIVCSLKKASVDLPAASAGALTVTSTVNDATNGISVSGLTVTSATIERLADVGGKAVYTTTVSYALAAGNGEIRTETIVLKHSPQNTDNTLYHGKLSYTSANDQQAGGNCQGTTGSVLAGTVLYEKTAEAALTYQLNYGEFCGKTTDPFDADNNIDPSDKFTAGINTDGWANNWHYGLYRVNPSNGTGSLAFAWQAGSQDGYTRVFNISTTAETDGTTSGTAYFGYGPDMATETDRGTITGFFCNWAGPGNTRDPNGSGAPTNPLAQKQVLTRASGATTFASESDDLAITFAPTTTCNASANMQYAASENFTTPLTKNDPANANVVAADNNKLSGATVTNNLISDDDVSFTMPTAPSDM
ncbi:MAG: hypothetical protein HYV02_04070 [Deltaproteobacteria bacterium]|nr:hypothetical protein [Deltaproteobacteria bacterium]